MLGHVREAVLEPSARRRTGAHYTPPAIARGLVAMAFDGLDGAPLVCDPAVGGGAFLLAAAEALADRGGERTEVVRRHCHGADVDALAVDVTRATLALWAGTWSSELDEHVVVADALVDAPWAQPFDVVVGNPPFQGQLGRRTSRSRATADALRGSLGAAVVGYVDTAALFLLRALELVRPGGRVALVQPHSTLATRDAAAVRTAVERDASLIALWFTEAHVFDAGVRVWAPVLERGTARPPEVRRRVDAEFTATTPVRSTPAGEWSALVSDLAGIPAVAVRSAGVVGDRATATAGFRDQFYGMVGAVHERREADDADGTDDDRPQLVTTGLIDVLATAWGRAETRFASQRWQCPVVDVDALPERVAPWVRAQLVPKLLVATQTKVVEVAVDERGSMVPSTPVIAVHAPPEQLWLLAAALSAPPVSALARARTYGSALSASALKLSARQVLDLPLPADHEAWAEAARCAQAVATAAPDARRAALTAFAVVASAAYGVADDDLVSWWLQRAAPAC